MLIQMDNPREEPGLVTPPELAHILAELIAREPIFHRHAFGTSRADYERMIANGFWETGASGRRYSREFVLDELERRRSSPQEDTWETSDFVCRHLAGEVYLLTYTLVQGERRTRRVTIWEKTADCWKIVYHQGTMVQDT